MQAWHWPLGPGPPSQKGPFSQTSLQAWPITQPHWMLTRYQTSSGPFGYCASQGPVGSSHSVVQNQPSPKQSGYEKQFGSIGGGHSGTGPLQPFSQTKSPHS